MSDIEAPLLETNDFEGNESCYIAKSFLDDDDCASMMLSPIDVEDRNN